MSSMRSRKRPPATRQRAKPVSAERAWPRWSAPFGEGAKRKTGCTALSVRNLIDFKPCFSSGCPAAPPSAAFRSGNDKIVKRARLRTIETTDDLAKGLAHLTRVDGRLKAVAKIA